jgi:hypothetical protein
MLKGESSSPVWPLQSLEAFISFTYRPVNLHIASPPAPSFSPLPLSTVQQDGSISTSSSDRSEDDNHLDGEQMEVDIQREILEEDDEDDDDEEVVMTTF